ncbi:MULTISPECIES: LuxR family transcriptional regulator [unclassified Streptomyces]|uniref:helix-turn-helix transcriptional regulator n=1 Tax=unclassified Streptomyces TaxID=2593676 RepID=UPI000360FC09|nr:MULTISPECIES: LuxR family transcriptional regulator [unclassified Streptomyces]MYY02933.1 AAA family ATPase [Streptomyces sp. SID4913]
MTPDVDAALENGGRVVVTGTWGSGKSTLLRAVADTMPGRTGATVLRAAPSPIDRTLPWSAAAELLAALPPHATARLSAPQRDTLAALTAPHGGAAPPALAVRAALASALAPPPGATAPHLIVIDNAQWVDGASAEAIGYVLRSTPAALVPTVFAVRGHRPPREAGLLLGVPATHVHLGPLTLDDVVDVLARHGRPTRWAAEVHRGSGGNAALVFAAARQGTTAPPDITADWPALLSPAARHTLLLTALARHPATARRAGGVHAEAHLAEAIEAGVLRVAPPHPARATDPLTPDSDPHHPAPEPEFAARWLRDTLASTASTAHRAEAHAALAAAEPDPVRAVLHRTLTRSGFDAVAAAHAEEAATTARRTGHPAEAAQLLLLAADRTPPEFPAARLARLRAAVTDAATGSSLALARQAADAIGAARGGPADQVAALLGVVDAAGQNMHELDHLLAHAAVLAAGDANLSATVHLRIALKANVCDGDPRRARAAADTAARLAHSAADHATEALALTMRARVERVLGHFDDSASTLTRALALKVPLSAIGVSGSPEYLAVRHAVFDDRLPEARASLLRLLPVAEQRGDTEDVEEVLRSLAEVDARAGRCARARTWAQRALVLCTTTGLSPGPAWYTAALTEWAGGTFRQAVACATHGLRASEEEGDALFTSRNLLALGSAHLAAGRPKEAVVCLRRVAELQARQHVTDARALVWQPELAEALAAARDFSAAEAELRRLAPAAARHPGSSLAAAALRSHAACLTAQGRLDEAEPLLVEAAGHFAALGLPMEQGRTLLAIGRLERSRRRVAAARACWHKALALFDAADATPWSTLTGDLLTRINGRSPGVTGPLTDVERRLARLVSEGASNQDAAARLFVSVKTVETTLSRIYRKLRIRGRTQLASAMSNDRDRNRRILSTTHDSTMCPDQ